jgi:hypothetical protein
MVVIKVYYSNRDVINTDKYFVFPNPQYQCPHHPWHLKPSAEGEIRKIKYHIHPGYTAYFRGNNEIK